MDGTALYCTSVLSTTDLYRSNMGSIELEPLTAQSDRVSSTGTPYSEAKSGYSQQLILRPGRDEITERC